MMSELESDERAHAMPEQDRRRSIDRRRKCGDYGCDHLLGSLGKWLSEPLLAAWVLHD